MVIDIHAHLWMGAYEKSRSDILKACLKYSISKVFLSGLGGYYPGENEISELNFEVYKFIKDYPERIGGFCYVNPALAGCMDELSRGIEEYGMSGMKLWVATYCDDKRVFPLVEKCIEYRIPVMIHSFHKAVGQLEYETVGTNVARLAEVYPEAKLIMAHLGGNAYHGVKAIAKYGNVHVDISGSLFRRDDVDYTKKHVGASRILFGTDMPGGSYFINIGQIEEADMTDDERRLVYGGNALRLLDRT